MRDFLFRAITSTLGRKMVWRIGRSLYMHARADSLNVMAANGETLMQEQLLRACVNNRIRPVIFDIGANVGEWSLSLLKAYENLEMENGMDLHCFEPVPATVEVLNRRLLSPSDSISLRIVPVALSCEVGTADMFIVGDKAGTNSLHHNGTGDNCRISVPLTTADAYCLQQAIPLVHYVKCDAEGHDAEVFSGAFSLLCAEKILTFQFEYNHRWVYSRHFLRDIFEQTKPLPYRMGKLTATGVELYEEWHP